MRRIVLLSALMASARLLASVLSGEGRSRRAWILLLAAIVLCLVVGTTAAQRQPIAQEQPQKPNVLFILTDDQAPEDLAGMSNVQSLLVDQGTQFSHAFATTPMCCPSRTSFMRGQYVHNHGVLTNGDISGGGYSRFIELGLQDSNVATWLHDDAGYSTFYAGKFLNGYSNTTYVPPGWDRWYAFSGQAQQDYTVNENGTLKTYTQDQQHETYYLRDRAEAFIRNRAQGAPWFAWVSTHAPHGPHTIAPEFQGSYGNAEMFSSPSYNEFDVSDKPAWIQAQPLLDDDCSTDKGKFDCNQQVVEAWRDRQESLMSVDVMVRDLVIALAETNQLDHTYIVFASDNGYLLYRHRVYSKSWVGLHPRRVHKGEGVDGDRGGASGGVDLPRKVESEIVTEGKGRAAVVTEASLLLAVIFLGTNPVAVKLAVLEVPPLPFVAIRFSLAGLLLLLVALSLGRGREVRRKDLLSMAGVGIIGVGVNNTAFTLGVSMTTASETALIYAAVPIWGILLGLALGLERPTLWGIVGVALAFLGVGVVVYGGLGGGGGSSLEGDLLVVIATICWGSYTVLSLPLLRTYSPIVVAGYTMLFGGLAALPLALPGFVAAGWSEVSGGAWGAVAYSTLLVAAYGFWAWQWGVSRVGANRVLVYQYLITLVGVVSGVVLLGESLTLNKILGGAVILLGVYLARRQ